MKVVLTALVSAVVAGTAVLAGAPSAAAAPGHIGLVVRYADGRVSAGCTSVGGDGLQVLERKHSVTMGTQQYSGFVLRIDGTGTSRPDNTHYWSYWHSSGSGRWAYASSGAASYTPRAGTVEGWSFVNGQNSAPRPPAYTYARLCGTVDPKPTQPASHPAPRPVHTTPTRASAPSRTAVTTQTHVAPPPPAHRHPSRAEQPVARPSHASSHPGPGPTRSATTAAAVPGHPTITAPSPVAQSTHHSSSAAWPTIGALLVIVALGAAGWLVARRRTG